MTDDYVKQIENKLYGDRASWDWQYFNRIDEQGRFCGLKITAGSFGSSGQFDSHTMSYLACRKIEKGIDPGPFGLELVLDV